MTEPLNHPADRQAAEAALTCLHNGIREAGVLGLSDVTITLDAAIAIRAAALVPDEPTMRGYATKKEAWEDGYDAGVAQGQRLALVPDSLDVNALRDAIYNTAVGPDECKTWGRVVDIAAEYERLAALREGRTP